MTSRDLEKELEQLGRDVAPGPSMKAEVLKRLEAIPERNILPICLWRQIMNHPMTRISVAASILMAVILSVFFWDQTSSTVFAEVLSSIDKVGSFSIVKRKTITGQRNNITDIKITTSEVFGIRMTQWKVDPNTQERHLSQEGVLSILQGEVTVINHEKKLTARINLNTNDDVVKGMLGTIQNMDPRTMLSKILVCEYESIGFSKVDGKTVEGFQTTDPNYIRFRKPRKKPGIIATAWIDKASKLPVRIEETINWVNGNKWYTVSDFEWEIPLKASDFELTIPEHYVHFDFDVPTSGPAYDPNSAISGLRHYREKHQRYPKKLEKLGMMAILGPELPEGLTDEQLREYLRNNKEKLNKMTMGPMNGTIKLYRLLKEENRDWAYYGDRVTPEMTDTVLWRWSTPKGTYSVILGDLRLIEVTKEELEALEAELPH